MMTYAALYVVLLAATQASLAVGVQDDFNDGALDAAWSISLEDASGWSHAEAGTALVVTDIAATVVNHGSDGTWGRILLSRDFSSLADFEAKVKFAWESHDSLNAMQRLIVTLQDADDNPVARFGYHDAWVEYAGRAYAEVYGESGEIWRLESIRGSLPMAGSASIGSTRSGDSITVLWDGLPVVSGTNGLEIASVTVAFDYYAYNNEQVGTSFFGTESLDLVEVIPEPATMSLLALGLGALAIRRRKRR